MATVAASPTSAALDALRAPLAREELRQFLNWALIWIGLVNIGFAAMWFVGSPPRAPAIMVAAVIGLLVRKAPRSVQFCGFLAATTYSVLDLIAGIFNLEIRSLIHSFRFLMEINPTQSTEYVVVSCLVIGLCAIAWLATKRDTAFSDWRLVPASIVLALGLAGVDLWMGERMRGHYARSAYADSPFESAMVSSDAERIAISGNRNLVIVMVESLGLPSGNDEMDRLLFSRFNDPAVARRFASTRGTSLYYNSTTAAEVRELCGYWGDYHELLDGSDASDCLPARMSTAGYSTTAYHSFTGSFFERDTWYPLIGFGQRRFGEQLQSGGAQFCGGVFPGACDRDVPRQLGEQLKVGDDPQLIYWLTVNSHLPVPLGSNLEVDECARLSKSLAEEFPMICRQFALWDSIEVALLDEILADDFPPSDILIVGDHMPPYVDARHRSQFAPDRVPWLHLRWKGGPGETAQIAAIEEGDDGA